MAILAAFIVAGSRLGKVAILVVGASCSSRRASSAAPAAIARG